jgi:hypothetical protein
MGTEENNKRILRVTSNSVEVQTQHIPKSNTDRDREISQFI